MKARVTWHRPSLLWTLESVNQIARFCPVNHDFSWIFRDLRKCWGVFKADYYHAYFGPPRYIVACKKQLIAGGIIDAQRRILPQQPRMPWAHCFGRIWLGWWRHCQSKAVSLSGCLWHHKNMKFMILTFYDVLILYNMTWDPNIMPGPVE